MVGGLKKTVLNLLVRHSGVTDGLKHTYSPPAVPRPAQSSACSPALTPSVSECLTPHGFLVPEDGQEVVVKTFKSRNIGEVLFPSSDHLTHLTRQIQTMFWFQVQIIIFGIRGLFDYKSIFIKT